MAESITFQATESNETITVTINEQARGPNGSDGATGSNREVKSASFTAENGKSYSVVATATITDPSPVEGKGYSVLVRNGTVTIGGTAYSLAGTTIERVFHSGAWASYPYSQVGHTHVSANITDASAGAVDESVVNVIAKFGPYGELSATKFSAASVSIFPSGILSLASTNSGGVITLSGQAATQARSVGFPDESGTVTLVAATQTLTNKTLTAPSMSAPVVTGTARMTMASVTGTPAATDAITRGDGDTRYGAMIVMRIANDKDITAGSLTDISDTDIALESSADYEISGFLGIQTTGGSPTNRVQFRFSYTGTLQSNQGYISLINSSGAIFPMVNGAFLTTAFADTSNVDRSYPIIGTIRTSTSGTLRLQGWRVSGGTVNPKLLAGSILILRKL